MENFESWAWLIVVAFIVATRILPRLFRGKESEPQTRQPSAPRPVQDDIGSKTDLDSLAKSRPRKSSSTDFSTSSPPPIKPK